MLGFSFCQFLVESLKNPFSQQSGWLFLATVGEPTDRPEPAHGDANRIDL